MKHQRSMDERVYKYPWRITAPFRFVYVTVFRFLFKEWIQSHA